MNFYDDLEKFSSNIALITDKSDSVTYKNLQFESDNIGSLVQKRSIVLLIGNNSRELITGYIGFLRRRAVIIFISDVTHISFVEKLIKIYKPEFIFKPSNKFESKYKEIFKFFNYHLVKTEYKHDKLPNKNLALLLSTSGSTGSPKFVRQSYKNINCNTKSIASSLKISKKDRMITTLKPSYTYGLSMINTHIFKGASIIITNCSLVEKEFWKLLKKEKATTFGGVPFMYEILSRFNFSGMKLSSLKYITQAGGKLNNEILKKMNTACLKNKIKFYVMYGQTEATARMSCLSWEYLKKKLGSIGKAIPGGKFYIFDKKKNTISKKNTYGELIYKGKNVSLGYAKKFSDLIKGDENKGVLFTGDLARKDKDNFYYIVGRKKRFSKIFGNRINLDELEQNIKNLGYDCACVGNDRKIQIFLTNLRHRKYLERYIPKITSIHPSGFIYKKINNIPRSHSGKILYSNLN